MSTLDLQLSQYIFEWGRELPPALVRFLATDLVWILLLAILFVSLRVRGAPRLKLFGQAVLAATLAFIVNALIGWLYFRARPFVALLFSPLIEVSALGKSFPSDHAATAFALAAVVWRQNKKVGASILLLALLVALGRVLAGVHYFSDIAAGALVGVAAAWFLIRIRKQDSGQTSQHHVKT